MSDLDLARLRAVAEAVITPGPWRVASLSGYGLAWVEGPDDNTLAQAYEGEMHPADAEHIATFDPPTVLALLDRLAAAESGERRAQVVQEAVDAGFARWERP